MSRSFWAWPEGRALAGTAVRSARKWAQRGDGRRGDRRRALGSVLPSFIRPVLALAITALAVGAMPASALAQRGHAATTQTRYRNRDGSHPAVRSPRSRADGRSVRAALTGDLVLAAGAGYNSADGSPLVRALQQRLASSGDRPGPIDGRYGPLTEQAVRRFQSAHGLAADGIAGPITLAVLTSPPAGEGICERSAGSSASTRFSFPALYS